MQVKEIMAPDVEGISPDANLIDALQRMRTDNVSVLPVYDAGKFVGTLYEHDVAIHEADSERPFVSARVGDVMRRDGAVTYDDQDVREAARLLRDKHLEGLVVLPHDQRNGQAPVGVLTLADLTKMISEDQRARIAGATSFVEGTAGTPQARVFLQPIAAPSILGLYGFAGATFIVAAHMAGWFGTTTSALFLFPFAAFFGGLAQFMAGMWAFRARDGLATAMHGTWGSFWMAYGLLNLLFATRAIVEPTPAFPELGYWFIALALITWAGTFAAAAESYSVTAVLAFLAAGSTVATWAFINGALGWQAFAGWLFIVSAALAFYTASAMMIEGAYRRPILPLFKRHTVRTEPIEYVAGQPGVKVGQ
jgi:hypothetical protein